MHAFHSWVLCAALVTVSPTLADGISGTYVGQNSTGAYLIQIVQTSGGHLEGRYSEFLLKDDGKIEELNAALLGASDGHTVALTIKPTDILSRTLALSGTIEGSLLHISSGSNFTLNLTKGSEVDFTTQVTNLKRQAEMTKANQTLEQIVIRLEAVPKQMSDFAAKLPAQIAKFPAINQRYRIISDLMRSALARERSILGGGQASVARSQISIAINQAGIEASQLHGSIQSSRTKFETKASSLSQLTSETQKVCQTNLTADNDKSLVLLTRLKNTCIKFSASIADFQNSLANMRKAFIQNEDIWNQERAKQELLIQSAQSAER